MKKLIYPLLLVLVLSCTKEQFQTNKSSQSSAITAASTASATVCSQSTLVKPKVDILMVWDNTSSFNFVTTDSKLALTNLITSVSEKFDYHIITTPLVPASTASLFETTLIASDPTSVSGNATSIVQTKDTAIAGLGFTQGPGSAEMGIDRAYKFISSNISNGMFRSGAYTIIVVMSNEDDKGCELNTGYNSCTPTDKNNYLAPYKQKMLCLRGATSAFDCSSYPTLNSSMMRFITIAPLTACSNGLNKINYNYKTLSQYIYNAPYNNGWPTASDDISPDVAGYPDSRNLCTVNFSHIFDNVNTAIKETLIKHVYNYWPVAKSTDSVDPQSIMVTRDDGKVLINNTGASNPVDGYAYIGDQVNQATRSFPTAGEYFTGKMIQLFGTNNDDLIVYPHCLTISYQQVKSNYGYIYLQNGQPVESTIEVTINGTVIPKSATNGWTYMGLQFTSALDGTLKAANLPAGTTSGYFIKLNGTAQVSNASNINIQVFYTSAATP